MKRPEHIDEHQIELYVLGSSSAVQARRRIVRHLSACADCRRIADEFTRIYADAEKHAAAGTSVVTVERRRDPQSVAIRGASAAARPLTPVPSRNALVRFVGYCRSHPVVAGVGGTFLLGSVAVGLALEFRGWYGGPNPASYHYNVSANYLEVLDAEDRIVWKKPGRDLNALEAAEGRWRTTFTVVNDLDGDGENEVVTQVPLVLADGKLAQNLVRIFDASGDLRRSISLGEEVTFGSRTYDGGAFGGSGLAVVDVGGRKDVIALAPHWRSPTAVVRLAHEGQVLGEYWHYGHFTGIYAHPSAAGGKSLVVLTGVNEARDSLGERFPEIVVLDPERVSGKTESAGTRGFGFPVSTAEIARIRLPFTVADSVLGTVPHFGGVTFTQGGMMHVLLVCASNNSSTGFGLEYVFDPLFQPVSVLPLDDPDRTLVRLHREGRLRSVPDAAYFEHLRKQVAVL